MSKELKWVWGAIVFLFFGLFWVDQMRCNKLFDDADREHWERRSAIEAIEKNLANHVHERHQKDRVIYVVEKETF